MKNILFRCDAGTQIGTGHFFRCLTIADRLKEEGAHCSFLSREMLPSFSLLLEGRHNLHLINQTTSEHQEIKIIEDADPFAVVLDHYEMGIEWQAKVAKCRRLIIIDDLANRPLHANFVLNFNFDARPEAYFGKVPAACELVLGPGNSLLKKEVRALRHSPPPVRTKQVFCFFGGSDPTGETSKLAMALRQRGPGKYRFVLAVNRTSPALPLLLKGATGYYEVHSNPDTFHHQLAESEIFLGAGGTITYERLFLGVPGFVVAVADNQAPAAMALGKGGYHCYLGRYDEIDYQAALTQLERVTPEQRQRQKRMGQNLVQLMTDELWRKIFW